MIKTVVMVVGLAVFTGASVACFGLFSDSRDGARAAGTQREQRIAGQQP